MNTNEFNIFLNDTEKIQNNLSDNDLINRLLFANLITVFEVYLQDIFVELLNNSDELKIKLSKSQKYKNHKILLSKAIANDMSKYSIEMVKNLIYHNLSDIEPLFHEVLGVKIELRQKLLEGISIRHDIIHRNGYDKNKNKILLEKQEIEKYIFIFRDVVERINNQIYSLYIKGEN